MSARQVVMIFDVYIYTVLYCISVKIVSNQAYIYSNCDYYAINGMAVLGLLFPATSKQKLLTKRTVFNC